MAEIKTPKAEKKDPNARKKKPARGRYVAENHQTKNKVIRATRHKKLLARRAKRKAANPDYVLPSKIKRFMKRSKKAEKAAKLVIANIKPDGSGEVGVIEVPAAINTAT